MRLILLATSVAFVCQMLAGMAGADATSIPRDMTPVTSPVIERLGSNHLMAAPKAKSDAPVVVLAVVVEADGTISNATIAQGTGVAAVDWLAIEKARKMRVQPAMVDGRPVRAQTKIAVRIPGRQQPAPKSARAKIKSVPTLDI